GRAIRAVRRAELGVDHFVARRAVGDVVVVERAGLRVLSSHGAEMQEAQMAGVDVTLERLEPVALAQHLLDLVLTARQEIRLQVRQGRRRLTWPHVRPDDVIALDARIRARPDLRLEVALGWLVRHVDARAFAIEFPAVIHAPEAFSLVATEEER